MYAETGHLSAYMQNFGQDIQQLEEYCTYHKPNAPMGNISQASTISEYEDLFKAPEPIIEEPVLGLGPMTAAISTISCGEEFFTPQGLKMADIESIQSQQLFSEFFYECMKDLVENAAVETPFSEVLDIKIPTMRTDENRIQESKLLRDAPLPKSVSSGCLSAVDWMRGAAVNASPLDFPGMNIEIVYGMRRAFSEGDIKALGNSTVSLIHSPLEQPSIISNCSNEDRKEKLSRYRNKKTKRNFGRQIKYVCRKALADSQPRVRGRFAKTEEPDVGPC